MIKNAAEKQLVDAIGSIVHEVRTVLAVCCIVARLEACGYFATLLVGFRGQH